MRVDVVNVWSQLIHTAVIQNRIQLTHLRRNLDSSLQRISRGTGLWEELWEMMAHAFRWIFKFTFSHTHTGPFSMFVLNELQFFQITIHLTDSILYTHIFFWSVKKIHHRCTKYFFNEKNICPWTWLTVEFEAHILLERKGNHYQSITH